MSTNDKLSNQDEKSGLTFRIDRSCFVSPVQCYLHHWLTLSGRVSRLRVSLSGRPAPSAPPASALRLFIKTESYYALRVTAIDRRLGLGGGKGGVQCGGDFFFLSLSSTHVCVLREFTCGGGGATLEESVPHPRMHVGLPWVNPPTVCVCTCVLAVCVTKSPVAESSLNKGSF